MNEYRLTRDADADLLDIFLFGLTTFGLARAEVYRDGLIRCFDLLASTPKLGRNADDFAPGARRHEHARHVIIYDEKPFGILITGVVHARSIRRLPGPG